MYIHRYRIYGKARETNAKYYLSIIGPSRSRPGKEIAVESVRNTKSRK